MDPLSLLEPFLVCVLYPAWLLAGGVDYMCHRRTHIEVVQFMVLAAALTLALLLRVTLQVFACIAALVLSHSVLAYLDVRYTQGRRHISPLEQTAHGFMDVIPLVAACLIAILHWPQLSAGLANPWLQAAPLTGMTAVLLGSFLLSGVPVLEEWSRTRATAIAESK